MSCVATTVAVGVERVGLHAEHDLADVALAAVADEAQQPGHRADADDEHPGGAGVERPGVADAALAEAAAQHADDVVAGDAGRLVDDGQAVDGRRAAPGHCSGRVAAVGAVGAEDVLDALGGADHVVGPEHEDRRLLRAHLAVDRRLDAPAVLLEHLEERGVAVLALEASRRRRTPG